MSNLSRLLILISISSLSIIWSCKEEKTREIKIDNEKLNENLKAANEEFVKIEDNQIDNYLERRGWKFVKTATGLRYLIINEGHGVIPKSGERVYLDYTISLIRGELLYSSKKDGEKVFSVDYSEEISGLNELVKYMKVGAEAKAVIPSYLAYGLHGDDNKIQNKATIIMDVKLKKISN